VFFNVSIALRVISPKLPIGVAIINNFDDIFTQYCFL
jgi:hypothetical protein